MDTEKQERKTGEKTVAEVIRDRVSLRVYDDRPIPQEELDQILEAALEAPTAGNQTLYSIIVIRDQETKDKLMESCDHQPFIGKAPVLLLFVSDQHKWFSYYKQNGVPEYADREEGLKWEGPNEGDLFLSIEDTMIAAQNAVIMAESLGIGSCYIGDILERYEYHKELFRLPDHVVPIALLCLGYYPEGHKRVHRKRFDKKYVVFEETYRDLDREDLQAMFAERAEGFVKPKTNKAENFAQAFYHRKTGAAFSKEMHRSVAAMLKDYIKAGTALLLAAVMALSFPAEGYAGSWQQNEKGWWWQNNDGSWPEDRWVLLDGNRDGTAEYYYFDEDGYLLQDGMTPDQRQVNGDGALVRYGKTVTRQVFPYSPDTGHFTAAIDPELPLFLLGKNVDELQLLYGSEVHLTDKADRLEYLETDRFPGMEFTVRNGEVRKLVTTPDQVLADFVSTKSLRRMENLLNAAGMFTDADTDFMLKAYYNGYEFLFEYHDGGLIDFDNRVTVSYDLP